MKVLPVGRFNVRLPMHLYLCRILAASLAGCALSGCISVAPAPVKPYQAPDPLLPSAQLTVVPANASMPNSDSEGLERRDVHCRPGSEAKAEYTQLAKWNRWSRPLKPVQAALPPGRISFRYEKVKHKSVCSIDFSAELEAGHSYALKMQESFQGWLKGTDCVLVMIDNATGAPVRLESASMRGPDHHANYCRKPAQP